MAHSGTPGTQLQTVIRGARRGFILAGVFSAFLNLLMLTTPIYMMQVFDRVLTTGHGNTLMALTLIVIVALAVLGVLEAVRLVLLSRTAAWVNAELGPHVVDASLKASLTRRAGGSQPLRDLSALQGFLGSTNLNPFFDAPWTPVFVLFIFLLHPLLGLLALAAAIALLAIAVLNDRTSRPAIAAAGTSQMHATMSADEAIRNAEVVQAMGLAESVRHRWAATSAIAAEKQDGGAKWMGLALGLSRFMRFGAQAGVLGLGAALVLNGSMTPGGMIAGSILLGRALAPVDQAIGAWRAFVSARESYARLARLFETSGMSGEAMPLPAPKGRVSVEAATFLHRGTEHPAIGDVSFVAGPGETVAIIGPSASGKSTLCRLLVGAWRPTSGHVRLDGAEIADWPRADFGKHTGYLPQDVELFSGSVRDNIARLGEADPDAVVAAAMAAGVHEMILQLPKGYETPLGPLGAALSGGQRQRIGLARALFGDPRYIVLDEPNANLDTAGDAALAKALAGAQARGATIFLATHRRQLLALADKVVMLNAGRLQAFGPRDSVFEALEQRGILRAGTTPANQDGRPGSSDASGGTVTRLSRGDNT